MKHIVAIVPLLCASSFAGDFKWNDSWSGQDKAYHFTAGTVIGGTVAALTANVNYGMIAGCGVGALKEIHDMRRSNHTASMQDLAITCLGSVIGAQLVDGLYLTPRGITYRVSF